MVFLDAGASGPRGVGGQKADCAGWWQWGWQAWAHAGGKVMVCTCDNVLSLAPRALPVNSEREVWCRWKTQTSALLPWAMRLCEDRLSSLSLSLSTVASWIMAPQRCARPNHRNLWLPHLTQYSGLCRCHLVNALEMETLSWMSGWARCHVGFYERDTGAPEQEWEVLTEAEVGVWEAPWAQGRGRL